MRAILRAFTGEWRAIFSDGGALLILVGAIAIYAIVYPVPYAPEVLKEVPVAVVNLDGSSLSLQLVRMLDAQELVRVAAEPRTRAEAESMLRNGGVEALVVIPSSFRRDVARGEQAWIGVYTSSAYFLSYRQTLTGIVSAVGTMSAGIEIRRLEGEGMTFEQAKAARDPLPLSLFPLFNAVEGYATYVVPPVLVLILQQTLLIGVGLLAGTRRELGAATRTRGLAGAAAEVLGRGFAYVTLYAIHGVFYFGVVYRVLGFPERSGALRLAALFVPFILATTFLAIAIGEMFPRREVAIPALLFTSLPAIFLAGFSWPPEALPGWLYAASLALPSSTAIGGFLRLTAMGASLRQVSFELAVLSALTLVYFAAACLVHATRGDIAR